MSADKRESCYKYLWKKLRSNAKVINDYKLKKGKKGKWRHFPT